LDVSACDLLGKILSRASHSQGFLPAEILAKRFGLGAKWLSSVVFWELWSHFSRFWHLAS